ncbi:hypothetical protein AJ80_08567 [Polytolypa hystricis UAMH7299]|uniref:RTA1 domain-containing protein n=1 Tax=Polytolypa hystricis (strain UAMH7299) TaxID=1447883 RepID=A0A2B7X586_POLH7|nr:hypothetical protein AJ80_08567 [Polytolypa hystricis UAMH7299]
MANDEEFHDFYKYTPSKAASIIFIILFLLSSSLHLFQLLKGRVWFFIPIVVGGVFEIVGFAARIISSTQAPLFEDTPYIIQNLFLLLAPALFAASTYMELGRIVALVQGEQYIILRRTWMTKIFVTGDIMSFVVQGAGGGIMSSGTPSNLSLGQNIIILGLAIQLLFFSFFIIVSLIFHRRMTAYPTAPSLSLPFSWRKHLYALYAASVLIMLRSIFRVVEYVQGSDGELLRHEVYLLVFDTALMLSFLVLMNVLHPAEISLALRENAGKIGSQGVEDVGLTRFCDGGSEEREGGGSFGLARSLYARHGLVAERV